MTRDFGQKTIGFTLFFRCVGGLHILCIHFSFVICYKEWKGSNALLKTYLCAVYSGELINHDFIHFVTS